MAGDRAQLLIGGEWVAGQGDDWIAVDDPATEEVIGQVPAGTAADVDRAVAAAAEAFTQWRWLSADERAAMLHTAADKTAEHWDDLVELLTREQGKPKPEQEEELEWSANPLRYYAELARNGRGRIIPSGEPRSQLNLVLKEPYGVVGAIVPWNYPLLLLSWKLAPALAAGNTVVIKPSEYTSLITLEWVRRCFDHFPAGVVNVVTGTGQDAGEALVRHPDVRVVAMTGSVETGQRIASVAAPMMKHVHLELGGKDAFVIAPDAQLEPAVDALAYAALINSGQVCTSSERVYVPSRLRDDVAEALREKVEGLRLGHGLDEGTDLGPLRAERFRDKIERHVADARERGARIVTGGGRPDDLDRGYFYRPTVLVDVDHDMAVMSEETFGPTIPIMAYDDIDQAIAWVNAHPMGLGATLRSTDPRTIKRFYEEVKVGTVWINDPLTDNLAGPFGGMKMTGGARELGEEGLDAFTESKHVHWDFSDEPKDWWYPY
ncbi:MAG TPA: aldehyde dehydrogenase family protein [Egibacteraceae bacterium]|nr:aldehyde dehydrogenase family protein [Egibacteraceae bacterium]